MKKAAVFLAASLLLLVMLPMTALAHGGSHRSSRKSYELCSHDDCYLTGNHRHDGVTYSGHHADDGHEYHLICETEGCSRLYSHTHDTYASGCHGRVRGCR